MKKAILLVIVSVAFLGSTTAWSEPPDGFPMGPFAGMYNYCVPEGTSIADAKAECEAMWEMFFWDVMPPVVVTVRAG